NLTDQIIHNPDINNAFFGNGTHNSTAHTPQHNTPAQHNDPPIDFGQKHPDRPHTAPTAATTELTTAGNDPAPAPGPRDLHTTNPNNPDPAADNDPDLTTDFSNAPNTPRNTTAPPPTTAPSPASGPTTAGPTINTAATGSGSGSGNNSGGNYTGYGYSAPETSEYTAYSGPAPSDFDAAAFAAAQPGYFGTGGYDSPSGTNYPPPQYSAPPPTVPPHERAAPPDERTVEQRIAHAQQAISDGAVTFTNTRAATDYGAGIWNDYAQRLNINERNALSSYSRSNGSLTYQVINSQLRSGRLNPAVSHNVANIDTALAGRPTPHTIVVKRGMNLDHIGMHPSQMPHAPYGFTDQAYMSTSLHRLPGMAMTKDAILELRVPANTPAMWMETVAEAGNTERELLLGRNLTYHVFEAVHDGRRWRLFGEVVPQAPGGTTADFTGYGQPVDTGSSSGHGYGYGTTPRGGYPSGGPGPYDPGGYDAGSYAPSYPGGYGAGRSYSTGPQPVPVSADGSTRVPNGLPHTSEDTDDSPTDAPPAYTDGTNAPVDTPADPPPSYDHHHNDTLLETANEPTTHDITVKTPATKTEVRNLTDQIIHNPDINNAFFGNGNHNTPQPTPQHNDPPIDFDQKHPDRPHTAPTATTTELTADAAASETSPDPRDLHTTNPNNPDPDPAADNDPTNDLTTDFSNALNTPRSNTAPPPTTAPTASGPTTTGPTTNTAATGTGTGTGTNNTGTGSGTNNTGNSGGRSGNNNTRSTPSAAPTSTNPAPGTDHQPATEPTGTTRTTSEPFGEVLPQAPNPNTNRTETTPTDQQPTDDHPEHTPPKTSTVPPDSDPSQHLTPARSNTVITASFRRHSSRITTADRAQITARAVDVVNQAYQALLENKPLPRAQALGRGARAGTSSTAGDRRNALNDAFKHDVRKQQITDVGIRPSDLFSTPLPLESGPDLTPSENRSAEIRLAPPPEPQVVMGTQTDNAQPVPRELHMAWFHGKMPSASAQNMRDWVNRAATAGWTVRLWTDPSAAQRNADLLSDLSRITGPDNRPVLQHSTNPADDLGIDGDARDLYDYSTDRELWPMQSDIVRYHALAQFGGLYADPDIGPGTIDLTRPLPPMDTDSAPVLAPLIRDEQTLGEINRELSLLQERTGADPERLPTPAQHQWRKGLFGNHLIIAPKNSAFLHNLISTISREEHLLTGDRTPVSSLDGDDKKFAKAIPARVTGPMRVSPELEKHIAAQSGNASRNQRAWRTGEWKIAPEYTDYLSGVEWVTADSSDFDKRPSTSTRDDSNEHGSNDDGAPGPSGTDRSGRGGFPRPPADSPADRGQDTDGDGTRGPGNGATSGNTRHNGEVSESNTAEDQGATDEFGGLYDDVPTTAPERPRTTDPNDPWAGNPPTTPDLSALIDPKGGKHQQQPSVLDQILAELDDHRPTLNDLVPPTQVHVNLADRIHYTNPPNNYDDGDYSYEGYDQSTQPPYAQTQYEPVQYAQYPASSQDVDYTAYAAAAPGFY
ncbi:ADP-ribosyltransferase, partial [Streptomonospora sediminis]